MKKFSVLLFALVLIVASCNTPQVKDVIVETDSISLVEDSTLQVETAVDTTVTKTNNLTDKVEN